MVPSEAAPKGRLGSILAPVYLAVSNPIMVKGAKKGYKFLRIPLFMNILQYPKTKAISAPPINIPCTFPQNAIIGRTTI